MLVHLDLCMCIIWWVWSLLSCPLHDIYRSFT